MAHKDFTYRYQNFLTEAVEKEKRARLQWYTEQKQRGNLNKSRPNQLEVFKRKIEGSKPVLQKLPPVQTNQQKLLMKKRSLIESMEKSKTFSDFNEMRPVTPKTKNCLYDGFTKEGKGRAQYLKYRYDIIPEDKFVYPLLSSWEYGWRLDDVIKKEEIKKPVYGRTRTVADTFFARNGIPTGDSDMSA